MTTFGAYAGTKNHGTWRTSDTGKNSKSFGGRAQRISDNQRESAEAHRIKATHRRWLKWVLFSMIGTVILAYVWNGIAAADTTTVSYQVKPGDTIWSVASRVAPGKDPRVVSRRILGLNHLSGSQTIYPGEILQLPRY